jgi:hypothetical protein
MTATGYADSFIKSLVERFPGLSPLLDEHLKDQDGELLAHVYFGDVTRYVVALIRDGSVASLDEAQQIINYLEATYRSNEDVQNLIDVSFLENLQQEAATEKALKMLGPVLTNAWQEMEAHWENLYRLREEREGSADKIEIGFKVGDKTDK